MPVLWPKREKRFVQKCHFWAILVLKVPCVFGPINRGPFGPNGRFPGTFWPKPSLLGCLRSLKKIGSKLVLQFFSSHFQILRDCAGFEAYYIVMGPAGPENGPKTPRKAKKKRVLVITLARGGVTGRSTPHFACTMRVPDRFRRVRHPNKTILTTFDFDHPYF